MSHQWWPDNATRSEFLSPTSISAGRGASADVARILASQFGVTSGTVLVAADDIVIASGLARPLMNSLSAAGLDVVISGGFGSEPTSEVVDAAADTARRVHAQVVVGIGGGSILDSSKLLSLLVRNDGKVADWLGPVTPANGVAPLLLIPTTCGTGSEATRIAMITVDGAKRASSCALYVPRSVVLDPDLLASLPGHVVASTAMDALAHSVESLLSTSHSPMSAHHAFRACELLMANIEAAVHGDSEALAHCLWGSHLAGQALNAGVVLGHSLAYCLAYAHPMSHGTSCALALPYCIAYNRSIDPSLAERLARSITNGRSAALRDAAGELKALASRLGLATDLAAAGIPPGAERAIASRCVTEYPRPTNPVDLDEARIERLLNAMRTGDLDAAFAIA